ncbi:MAG: cytochrome [Firmicutes bacterium]|nr:cytochrome [Bacillota bacterium]
MATQTLPPGPRPRFLRGFLPEFRRDPLALLTSVAHEYGPIARLQLGPADFFLLSDPDAIEDVLVTQNKRFHKTRALTENRRVLGNGLLTSDGEFWLRQRRLAQPAFHRGRIAGFGETMVAYALRHMDPWQNGETRDLSREMMRLTLAIAAKTLFSADVETDADRVGDALNITLAHFQQRTSAMIRIPESWPTPANRRFERAARQLDEIIYRVIEQRRSSDEDAGDLLSMLMQAEDEDGSHMSPQQLRDEAMTIFLAGHETTANVMAWTWYLLSRYPAAEALLHAELDSVLSGRAPTVGDLPQLRYVDAVITESMRLFPPAWIVGRTAIAEFTLGEYSFPVGTTVLMSQWVMHRHPRYFAEPLAFRPERWLDGLAKQIPAYAYFPFGGGPRVCIGKGFAQMEAALLLAAIGQRFTFRLEPGHPVVPQPSITLRPRHGVRMTLTQRV